MTLKPISATELRTRTREIMQRAKFMHETFLVENFGEPMAVIVGVSEYERLMQKPDAPDMEKNETESIGNAQ